MSSGNDYNWAMTGPPSESSWASDPQAAQSWNEFVQSGNAGPQAQQIAPPTYEQQVALAQSWGVPQDQMASIVGTPESVYAANQATAIRQNDLYGFTPTWAPNYGLDPNSWQMAPSFTKTTPTEISNYAQYGYQQPFSTQDIQTPVAQSAIRYGYQNTPYAAVKSSIPGLTSGGEYVVDPNSGRFVLDKTGKPIPVPQKPNDPNKFGDVLSDYIIPAGIALGSIPVLGGLAGQAIGALGGAEAATLTPGTDLAQLMQSYPDLSVDQLQQIMQINWGADPQLAYDAANLAANGYNAATIDQLLQYGYSAQELAPLGLESLAPTLPAAGATTAGLTATDLLKYGLPLANLASRLFGGSGSSRVGGIRTLPSTTASRLPPSYRLTGVGGLPGSQTSDEFLKPTFLAKGQPVDLIPPMTPQLFNLPGTVQQSMPLEERPTQSFNVGGEVHTPEFYSPGGYASTHVDGDGDGTSDSVPAMLADGEFVIPADVVSGLGNGSNKAGAKVLNQFLSVVREDKQSNDPEDLPPDSKGPLEYLAMANKQMKA